MKLSSKPDAPIRVDLADISRDSVIEASTKPFRRRSNNSRIDYSTNSMVRGLVIVAAILAVIVGLIALGRLVGPPAPTYQWTWSVVPQYIPFLLHGLRLTIILTVVTIVCGMVLGVFVAAARMSKSPPLQVFITAYIELMRGTPLLVQLVWMYYCLPIVTGVQLPAVASVLIALILNMGAFYGEAFRAGLQSIPTQELESARVLGLSYWQQMRYVTVPQAFRIILPVLISMSVSLFKDTSLVAIIGLSDLMYNGLSASISTYRPLELLSAVAVIYFIVAFPATQLLRRLEVHLMRNQ